MERKPLPRVVNASGGHKTAAGIQALWLLMIIKSVCALLLQVASEMGRMTLAWPVGKNIFLWHFYGLLQQVLDEASEIPSKQLCVPRRQQTVKHLQLRGLRLTVQKLASPKRWLCIRAVKLGSFDLLTHL